MPGDLQAKFEAQLPKGRGLSLQQGFHYFAGFASIVALLTSPFIVSDPTKLSFIYITVLTFLVVALFVYIYHVNSKKLHRYAQSVIFMHYVNHVIRDSLQEVSSLELQKISIKILDAVATCFSVIVGKRCRACLVELQEDDELKVTARDSISHATDRKQEIKHYLNDNTDFYDLWHALNGCSRFFLCNNLKRRWLEHKYKNSSFQQVGDPEVRSFFKMDFVVNWRLPYKSALVLPIRYISSFVPPDVSGGEPQNALSHWNYWGFLCLDCNSSNCFDDRFCPDLGGAFADALFTLFSQYEILLNKKIGKLT